MIEAPFVAEPAFAFHELSVASPLVAGKLWWRTGTCLRFIVSFPFPFRFGIFSFPVIGLGFILRRQNPCPFRLSTSLRIPFPLVASGFAFSMSFSTFDCCPVAEIFLSWDVAEFVKGFALKFEVVQGHLKLWR